MTAHDSTLLDDVDALKAMVRAVAEKAALLEQRNAHLEQVNQGAEERIARLMAIVKMLERERYGARSERPGLSGFLDYSGLRDRPPQSLWRCRGEPGP